MSLTLQFLIVSILPLSFLVMVWYLWQSGLPRRELVQRWTVVLLAAAVWASSVLRFYGGITFPLAVTFTWGVVGKYAFTVTAVALLLATFNQLSVPRKQSNFAVGLSIGLGIVSFALDCEIWPYAIPDQSVAGQTIRYFDLCIAIWITSWLVPTLAAWIVTRQVKVNFPKSLYRNQIHYWLLVLGLFIIGGALASIQHPGQPIWQEIGLIIVILAALTGTISIAHSQLPDLQVALRQLLSRLTGTFIIFGLTWLALSIIVRSVAELPEGSNSNLILILAAALLAGLFMGINRAVNAVIRRMFFPAVSKRKSIMSDYNEALGTLPDPNQLASLFLGVVQSELRADDAWLFAAEDDADTVLMLRPLASLDKRPLETVIFDGDSLFATYLRYNHAPLVQYDIDTLSSFDDMSEEEKNALVQWNRVLYMPLHAGSRLVGMLALGEKAMGDSYNRKDFERLKMLAPQISPLLAQAQSMAELSLINEHIEANNRMLHYEKRQLHERLNLFGQYLAMISPQLKRPFIPITEQIEKIEASLPELQLEQQLIGDLTQQVHQLQTSLSQLIVISRRLQTREDIFFAEVGLDEIVQQAIRSLSTMAEARRVHMEYDPTVVLPTVFGDAEQLQEAFYHLLHNAIKYNKIGGSVQLNYTAENDVVCLHINDTGVGIPKERLEYIWQGLSPVDTNGNGRTPGLGLALTRYIVMAHGGRVEVESKYGAGSIFSVYLPTAVVG